MALSNLVLLLDFSVDDVVGEVQAGASRPDRPTLSISLLISKSLYQQWRIHKGLTADAWVGGAGRPVTWKNETSPKIIRNKIF